MRIRTIKPEFWESETLGKVSREARLLFVGLFSCCDDSGRTRGNSRLLASRLYPYDEDALRLLPGWLAELQAAKCVRVYEVEGETFLDIPNWLKHQKIDKPSPSKFPEFRGEFANVLEDSRKIALEQGTGNREGEQGKGKGPKENLSLTTSTEPLEVEPPPGMPKTEGEAKAVGEMAGVPGDFAANEWHRAAGRGWRDAREVLIRNFRSYLKCKWEDQRSRDREAVARVTKPVTAEDYR